MLTLRNVTTWIAMVSMAILLVHELSFKRVLPEIVSVVLCGLLAFTVALAVFAQVCIWISKICFHLLESIGEGLIEMEEGDETLRELGRFGGE